MNRIEKGLLLLGTILMAACGGSRGPLNDAADANCPEGQTFDGEYCQVDQSVATAESDKSVQSKRPEERSPDGLEKAPGEEKPPGELQSSTSQESDEDSDPLVVADPTQIQEEKEKGPEGDKEPSFATPVDYAMTAQAAPVMHYLASSHLPSGSRPLGSPFAGQFATGQILEQKVQLKAGKCYTVVALGLPPVREVTVMLYDADDSPLAKDEMLGPQAVLGSRSDCYKATETGSVKLVVSVDEGRGLAAAQVFQK